MRYAKRKTLTMLASMSAALLSSCATVPAGPSVLVLPGTGKTFETFQADHAVCRDWAGQQVGTSTERVAREDTAGGAIAGAAIGATAGAVLGAASGHAGGGAAVGAGVGLLGGSAVGASRAESSVYSVQSRYDMAYIQCMYAKGNRVPVARGSFSSLREQRPSRGPPSASSQTMQDIPPPPPGTPPPPPPGAVQ